MLQIRPVHRKIQVYQSEYFLTPVTYGIVHPKIVLPARLSELSRVDMRNMIVHELVHIHRWDVAKRFFLIVVLCIHWFNPLVWVMFWLYQQDQEISCDEKVLKILKRMDGQRSKNYIYTMIKMSSKGEKFLAVHGFGGKSFGKKRILAAMQGKRRKGIQIFTVLLLGAFLVLSFVSFIPETQNKRVSQNEYDREKLAVLVAEEQESTQQILPIFDRMLSSYLIIQDKDFDFLAVLRDIEENYNDFSKPFTEKQRRAVQLNGFIRIAEIYKERQDQGEEMDAMELWMIEEYYDFVRKNYEMDEEGEKEYQHWRKAWVDFE